MFVFFVDEKSCLPALAQVQVVLACPDQEVTMEALQLQKYDEWVAEHLDELESNILHKSWLFMKERSSSSVTQKWMFIARYGRRAWNPCHSSFVSPARRTCSPSCRLKVPWAWFQRGNNVTNLSLQILPNPPTQSSALRLLMGLDLITALGIESTCKLGMGVSSLSICTISKFRWERNGSSRKLVSPTGWESASTCWAGQASSSDSKSVFRKASVS